MSTTDHPAILEQRPRSLDPTEVDARRVHPTGMAESGAAASGVSSAAATPAQHLIVRPWWDPDLAITGHPIDDRYIENFWLGVLGPSVICLLRRFSRGFETHPRGFRLSLVDTARAIGLGSGTGRQSPINRTIDRASTFHIARRVSTDEIDVRLHLPSLSSRQLARLPLAVQTSHDRWMAEHRGEQPRSGKNAA